MNPIRIEISPGELIDRITILQIRLEHLADPQRRAHAERELSALLCTQRQSIGSCAEVDALARELAQVNRELWKVEDRLRDCERRSQFDTQFIDLARSVYVLNDQRAALKARLTKLLGGNGTAEEKIYADPAARS